MSHMGSSPYVVRHTCASLLIAQGEHPKYIQAQMGHSSINVTMDTSGHLIDTITREAANRLGDAVFGGVKEQDGSRKQKRVNPVRANPLNLLEAASGFEPENNGFADRSLTTWVCRRFVCCSDFYRKSPILSRTSSGHALNISEPAEDHIPKAFCDSVNGAMPVIMRETDVFRMISILTMLHRAIWRTQTIRHKLRIHPVPLLCAATGYTLPLYQSWIKSPF